MSKFEMFKTDWELIKEANDLIETKELKGKPYAEVKERVIAFRRVHPLGQIITEIKFTENYVMCEATVIDKTFVDNKGDYELLEFVLAKGHAREYLKTEFALEKAETSAIGRALGFCGYGINTSIASAEDIENVDKPSEIFDEPPLDELVNKLNSMLNKQEFTDFMNAIHRVSLDKVPSYLLMAMIRFKEDEKHSTGQ